MLELTNAQIGGWLGQFLLPLFRIASMLMVMPVIGTQLVPVRVRLYLALAICVVLAPTLPPMPQVDSVSLQSMLLVGEQVLIGVMFGFMLQLYFHLFTVAGQIIAVQMGLGFASMVDPSNGVSVPVLGQFLGFLARDIANHPERLQAVDAGLVQRLQSLVGSVEVDLNAALSADDE